MNVEASDPFASNGALYLPMPCPSKDCAYEWPVEYKKEPYIKSHVCPLCGFLMTVEQKYDGKQLILQFVDKIRNSSDGDKVAES